MDALMEGPAGVPPPGVVSNLDNPDNQNGLAVFVITFCSAISTICVLLRAYGRVWLLKRFNVEDALVLCAYVSLISLMPTLSIAAVVIQWERR